MSDRAEDLPAPRRVIQRTVDSLQQIYAVLIALAIGQVVHSLFFDQNGVFDLSMGALEILPLTVIFLVTVVPFYQGMNRHLDACYVDRTANANEGALLWDFGVFFLEAAALFGFAAAVGEGLTAIVFIGALLLIDVVWGLVASWVHGKDIGGHLWAGINAGFLAVGVFLFFTTAFPESAKLGLFAVLAVARTTIDYIISWRFYFPRP